MATLKIKKKTTVGDLADEFKKKIGGVLKVYDGNNIAPDTAGLTALGVTTGSINYNKSDTVAQFINSCLKNKNLNVKVFTKDGWIIVLDDIQLRMVKRIPKNARKADLEKYIGNPGCFRRWF